MFPFDTLDHFITHAASGNFFGTVLIARDDALILHKSYGYANREQTVPITLETPFWIASVTKQFTAAAVLKLVEHGQLDLAQPITRYFENVPADKQGITLHQLLTHTAGFRQNYAADGITDRATALQALLDAPLKAAPGEGFGYSNDAYNLLALLVELVSGVPYETYLRQQVLLPAQLTHTGFWGEATNVAPIHGDVDEAVAQPNWGFRGAVGMSSTPADLYQWYRVLQTNVVLSPASAALLTAPHVTLRENETVGYGWFTSRTPRNTPAIWTRGTEGFGHNAILMTCPTEKLVIAAASNAGDYEDTAISRYLVEQMLPHLLE